MTKPPKDLNNENKSVITFPCDFPIKVVAHGDIDVEEFARNIVHQYIPAMQFVPITKNKSSKGNYQAITVTLRAENQQQIDSIYKDLTAHSKIIMVL